MMARSKIDHQLEAAVRQHFLLEGRELAFDFPEFPDDMSEIGVRRGNGKPPTARFRFECQILDGSGHRV